jgi:hypothetical protein
VVEVVRTARPVVGLVLALGAGLLAGCASNGNNIEPRAGQIAGLPPAEADARAEAVRRDPRAYLERVASNCRKLGCYELQLTRYERRGLLQQMYGPERIACWFRRRPFSVRMKWLDETIKYGESVYVEGQQGSKVRFVTRWWSPPLLPPPGINRIDPQASVTWGESKHPITDFGLERLMERTLVSTQKAGDDVVLSYMGLEVLPQTETTVHHLHLAYSENFLRVPIQELYVDVATDLPAGTVLKFGSGRIDAAYYYEKLNTSVRLTDDDFVLPAEREERAGPAPKPDKH